MTTNTKLLVIADITIKTDEEGRYSLNDLHKAAGNEERHKPVHFLKLQSTLELCDELVKGKDSYLLHPEGREPY